MTTPNNLHFKNPFKHIAMSNLTFIIQEKGYISGSSNRAFIREPKKAINQSYVRKKVNCITLLFDKIPPVFHKLTEGDQWIFRYGKLVVRCPGFHGNQYYPSLQLVFIYLVY